MCAALMRELHFGKEPFSIFETVAKFKTIVRGANARAHFWKGTAHEGEIVPKIIRLFWNLLLERISKIVLEKQFYDRYTIATHATSAAAVH